jgi:bifunctional non-homologous end joining protein LigD
VPAEAPEWVPVAPLPARSRRGNVVRYPLVNDRRTLLWFVDYGALDLHTWASRVDRPDRPDWAIFDLDPRGGDPAEAANLVREALDALGLESFPRTSGQGGVHVLVPLARVHEPEQVRGFVQLVAGAVRRAYPNLGVAIDAKMNGRGQQFVTAYSARPTTGRVCTPLAWEEVRSPLPSFTPGAVLHRVEERGDIHAGVLRGRQRLRSALASFAR